VHLAHPPKERSFELFAADAGFVGCADYIIECYGISRLIAEIDRDRDFGTASTVLHSYVDFIANEGFYEYFSAYNPDWPYQTAHEFRQRHLIRAIERLMT
jgi:hypothetical protein